MNLKHSSFNPCPLCGGKLWIDDNEAYYNDDYKSPRNYGYYCDLCHTDFKIMRVSKYGKITLKPNTIV